MKLVLQIIGYRIKIQLMERCKCGIDITGNCVAAGQLDRQMDALDNPTIVPPWTKESALRAVSGYEQMLSTCERGSELEASIKLAVKRINASFKN